MNQYDHEDAFRDANLHAGGVVNLSEALKFCKDRHLAGRIIQDAQKQYEQLFDAFIAGVAWAREDSLKKKV